VALFGLSQCDLTVNAEGRGTVNPEGRMRLDYGTVTTLTATPDMGCIFAHWVDRYNNIISTQNPFDFKLLRDTVVTAVFYGFDVVISASLGGKVVPSGTYRKFLNDAMELTATPNTGSAFKYWVDKDFNVISLDSSFTLIVKGDTALTARFVYTPYITLQSEPFGAILEGEGYYEANTIATVDARFISGCPEFKYWTDQDNNILSTSRTMDFEVTKDMVLTAHFVNYVLNISSIGEGHISAVSEYNDKYTDGLIDISCADIPLRMTIEAIPDAGCIFKHWRDENNYVTTINPFVIDLTRSVQRVAVFERIIPVDSTKFFTIDLLASPHNGGTVAGSGDYEALSSVTLSATASDGYRFIHWEDRNNNVISVNQSFTLVLLRDTFLVAKFVEVSASPTYIVQLISEPTTGGILTGSGVFAEGSPVNVSASARAGYLFVHWKDKFDNVVSTASSFTFTLICDTFLVATFDEIPLPKYDVTLEAAPADGGTVAGSGSYDDGTSVTITATPNTSTDPKYRFVRWKTESEVEISTENPYTFTISRDTILIAVFDLVGIKDYISTPIKVHPNPTNDNTLLTMHLDASCDMQVVVSDLLGNELLSVHDGFASAGLFIRTILTKDFPAGHYFLKITINGHQIVEKIIVY
jgi:hypothetical protein